MRTRDPCGWVLPETPNLTRGCFRKHPLRDHRFVVRQPRDSQVGRIILHRIVPGVANAESGLNLLHPA